MQHLDFDYAPYDSLTPRQRQDLQQAVQIAFYDDDAVVIEPQQPIEHLYVVMKGLVKEIGENGEVAALYRTHDTFDAQGLVQGGSPNRFVVAEQALLYLIPKDTVMQLTRSNSRFAAYFYNSVADKFADLAGSNGGEMAALFNAKVRDACRRMPLWLDGGTPVFQAALAMREHKTKSVLVRDNERTGLFTESAFRNLIIENGNPQSPVSQWSTFELISIDIDDFVFDALLAMTQHNIQRVIVRENGQPVAALEQIDVLAYLTNHSHLVAGRLDSADTLDELAAVAQQMQQSVQFLHKNGMQPPQLAQLMQVLNGRLFEKAWRIIAPAQLYADSCLIVMGSEGRGEQILKSDQDNALILGETADPAAAEVAAAEFSATLARFGYPPCAGGIMVSNPEWRKPLDEFKQTVLQWCRRPSAEGMMKLAIFTDARAVAGKTELLDEVKHSLQQHMLADAGMLMMFARAVSQFDHDAQGFFSQLLRRSGHEKMDVKKMGLFPIVHGVRALALENRLSETNTFERIKALHARNKLSAQMSRDLAEALRYLMAMRLKAGLLSLQDNRVTAPNQLPLEHLSTLERDLLKDALQVVKRFKLQIRQHFHIPD